MNSGNKTVSTNSQLPEITPDLARRLTLPELAALPEDAVTRIVCRLLWSVDRSGVDRLVMAMGHDLDFFATPASTRYHSAYEGGLAMHSLLVYRLILDKDRYFGLDLPQDSLAITALCHDLCKAGTYQKILKGRREGTKINQRGQTVANWVDIETWEVGDAFPVGHGEKSVIILQRYIDLSDLEIAMIVGHMGGFDERRNVFNRLAELWPAVAALHASDLEATYILEAREQAC